jgi:hypothetical protein
MMSVHELLQRLGENQRRGSKPRCHLLTHGPSEEVARRLTDLTGGRALVRPDDRWMPEGFECCTEAELHNSPRLLDEGRRTTLRNWWLEVQRGQPRLPNWDIASTCTIEDKPGLLLVEAKAHDNELRGEEKGKPLTAGCSDDSFANHKHIGQAIANAAADLQRSTGLAWAISRDQRYQMSNRFAVACKLTEMGLPVVLVYLGFLRADEMIDCGKPLASEAEWERLVKSHSQVLFPPAVWDGKTIVNGEVFWPHIRLAEVTLETAELSGRGATDAIP